LETSSGWDAVRNWEAIERDFGPLAFQPRVVRAVQRRIKDSAQRSQLLPHFARHLGLEAARKVLWPDEKERNQNVGSAPKRLSKLHHAKTKQSSTRLPL
jgi:hypothetical protein